MILAQKIKLSLLTGILLVILSLNSKINAATFNVTNNTAGWGAAATSGSFAWCLAQVNAAGAGTHTIVFNSAMTLAGGTGNPAEYTLTNSNVTIDAESMTGATCGSPKVLWDGPGYNTFPISGSNVTIKGMIINNFRLDVSGAGFRMSNCWFGLNAAGTAGQGGGNGYYISLSATADNPVFDGTTCKNVFAGNAGITNAIATASGTDNVQITNSYFGTDAAGANLITLFTGSSILIGGAATLNITGCVVNGGYTDKAGIELSGTNSNVTIQNSKIGVNLSGTYATTTPFFGSNGSGIWQNGGTINTGTITNNVISKNKQFGVFCTGATNSLTISNNTVGLSGGGTVIGGSSYGNGWSGICFHTGTHTNALVNNNKVCQNGFQGASPTFQKETCGIIFNSATVASATVSNNYVGVDASFNLGGNIFTGIYFFQCGNMGGSNAANVVVSNNYIGNNGETPALADINSNGISVYSSNFVTITGNYIGIGSGGQNIGNAANGIEINTVNTYIITNNNISNNKGRRQTSEAEAVAGIMAFNSQNGTIRGNTITNHLNAGGSFGCQNNGIVIQQGSKVMIGGATAGQPNTISANGTHGIHVLDGADFVQMTQNVIVCNASMGISLNIAGDPMTVASKGVGNNSFAVPQGPTTIPAGCPGAGVGGNGTGVSGAAPTSSTVEVFQSPSCRTCPSTARGEAQGYFGSTTAVAGNSYTYAGAISGNVSVTATGTLGGDCNSGNCRTSRFSDCSVCSLPVEWLFVNATLTNEGVLVSWATASEKNASVFVVERSFDGLSFESVSQPIAAAGTSTAVHHYAFTDATAFSGVAYYRIRQVDLDGAYAYSAVKTVVSGDVSLVKVYPNPMAAELNVFVAQVGEHTVTLKIYDITGRVVFQKSYDGAGALLEDQLNLALLPKGAYVINITNGAEVNYTEKLLKD